MGQAPVHFVDELRRLTKCPNKTLREKSRSATGSSSSVALRLCGYRNTCANMVPCPSGPALEHIVACCNVVAGPRGPVRLHSSYHVEGTCAVHSTPYLAAAERFC